VFALVELAVEIERSVEERIFQKHLDVGNGKDFSVSAQ
tara:strand:+ start:16501 stop:16614 length:114 start_codon:yes stop_codon:yes gene_type:complete